MFGFVPLPATLAEHTTILPHQFYARIIVLDFSTSTPTTQDADAQLATHGIIEKEPVSLEKIQEYFAKVNYFFIIIVSVFTPVLFDSLFTFYIYNLCSILISIN